jgi:hypothetical protein
MERICISAHGSGGVWEFNEGNFLTVYPGREITVEKSLKVPVELRKGEVYSVYSRADREKKKCARGKGRWGGREELAATVIWEREEPGEEGEEGEGGDDAWVGIDTAGVVRDGEWMDVGLVVGNSVRFMVG